MRKDDFIRLRHMCDAAIEARSFVSGKKRADLDRDRMLALSLVKCIEIIGEAAAQLTEDGRKDVPGIPWPSIIGMRNRLIHAYFDIDLDRVWDSVVDDLPPLIAELDRVLR
jgi:uncharacterized protein with HEPN domain